MTTEQLPGAALPIYKPKEQSSFNALLQALVYYNLSSKRPFFSLAMRGNLLEERLGYSSRILSDFS